MKFESKFGIGEICLINATEREGRKVPELMVKVAGVIFGGDTTTYEVENITTSKHIQYFRMPENQLVGDPDFDQEAGCYPAESDL